MQQKGTCRGLQLPSPLQRGCVKIYLIERSVWQDSSDDNTVKYPLKYITVTLKLMYFQRPGIASTLLLVSGGKSARIFCGDARQNIVVSEVTTLFRLLCALHQTQYR